MQSLILAYFSFFSGSVLVIDMQSLILAYFSFYEVLIGPTSTEVSSIFLILFTHVDFIFFHVEPHVIK